LVPKDPSRSGQYERPGMLWQAENIYILEEDRHTTCEEITIESAIPESLFHHVLTEVLKRK
jgi:hypothetical protein